MSVLQKTNVPLQTESVIFSQDDVFHLGSEIFKEKCNYRTINRPF